jgi:hypothetical protein
LQVQESQPIRYDPSACHLNLFIEVVVENQSAQNRLDMRLVNRPHHLVQMRQTLFPLGRVLEVWIVQLRKPAKRSVVVGHHGLVDIGNSLVSVQG